MSNDDLIIDCVLFYGKSCACKVLLASCDKNLILKALAHGVNSIDKLTQDGIDLRSTVQLARAIHNEGIMVRFDCLLAAHVIYIGVGMVF